MLCESGAFSEFNLLKYGATHFLFVKQFPFPSNVSTVAFGCDVLPANKRASCSKQKTELNFCSD